MARKSSSQKLLPEILDHEGNPRPLGCLPQTSTRRMMAVPSYRDVATLIPEKEWEPFDEWPVHIKRKDQNGKGACNGFAAALGVMLSRYVSGMDDLELSGWYIYSILCRGIDQGSLILDALELLESKGVAPEADVKYGLINPAQLSAQAHKNAARFKVELGSKITTYEELGTAIVRREPINLAICVADGFNNLDKDGVPPLGRGYCNHAVFVGMGLSRRSNGEVLGNMTNSWNSTWGIDGRCNLPLKKVVQASYFEAYTLRAVFDDTADTSRPPKFA